MRAAIGSVLPGPNAALTIAGWINHDIGIRLWPITGIGALAYYPIRRKISTKRKVAPTAIYHSRGGKETTLGARHGLD
jgi:hypothetical protein